MVKRRIGNNNEGEISGFGQNKNRKIKKIEDYFRHFTKKMAHQWIWSKTYRCNQNVALCSIDTLNYSRGGTSVFENEANLHMT